MDTGGLAQMSHSNFVSPNGLPLSNGNLASRRGGQNIKPLSFEATKSPVDNGAPTPRTSRSHLLAGLRTAPKSATVANFSASAAGGSPMNQMRARNAVNAGGQGSHDSIYSGPKTAVPRFGQQQGFNGMAGFGQQYTADQILAPPEIQVDEQGPEHLDPDTYARLVATNMYLAQQQQRLQQQLMNVQAAQQQFQAMNINPAAQSQQMAYQQLYQQQQQQLRNLQQQMLANTLQTQGSIYTAIDPTTGQQTYYVDQSQGLPQLNAQFVDQYNTGFQQQQQLSAGAPSVQVSPPTAEARPVNFRNTSPPRRFDSPTDQPTPLPPPSANAFRRGHKKSSSLANVQGGLSVTTQEPPKSAGPKSAHFPLTPSMTGSYGPGQARAGEHPTRQPRGPPNFEELSSKPTAKHEGSKNFVTRTRRSAVHNLMRAGISRRQVTHTGSSGSISPISESAEEIATPMTDSDSDSGRSGSGSLNGDDVECSLPSSRTSTGSWGAIGSDRPGSRQKVRKSVDSLSGASDTETTNGSFAAVFKSAAKTPSAESTGQRKAPMLVLTSAEKRKVGTAPA